MEGQPPSDSELSSLVAEAADSLPLPASARSILDAVSAAIREYSAGSEMPEVIEQVAKNRMSSLIGELGLSQTIESEVLHLWQEEVNSAIASDRKLPRKTKKAVQKAKKGKQLGQRELARLQALREQGHQDEA